jgi:hypothetical protein
MLSAGSMACVVDSLTHCGLLAVLTSHQRRPYGSAGYLHQIKKTVAWLRKCTILDFTSQNPESKVLIVYTLYPPPNKLIPRIHTSETILDLINFIGKSANTL